MEILHGFDKVRLTENEIDGVWFFNSHRGKFHNIFLMAEGYKKCGTVKHTACRLRIALARSNRHVDEALPCPVWVRRQPCSWSIPPLSTWTEILACFEQGPSIGSAGNSWAKCAKLCVQVLSGLSQKFLDISIVSLEFASGVVLGEGPVDRFAVAIALVSPRLHCLT